VKRDSGSLDIANVLLQAMKAYGEVEVQLHSVLTSAEGCKSYRATVIALRKRRASCSSRQSNYYSRVVRAVD
jgi:hypothetical protein